MNPRGGLNFMSNVKKTKNINDIREDVISLFDELNRLNELNEQAKDTRLEKDFKEYLKKELEKKIREIKTEMHNLVDLIKEGVSDA